MSNLRISIIIPAYNEEGYLPACLDAIAAQTIKPFEVIVVDNNSTDRTVTIAQSYPFVRVIHESQQGIVFARNAGYNSAKGTIIARIDADTRLPVVWVAAVKAFYSDSRNNNIALTGGATPYNVRFPQLFTWIQQLVAFYTNYLLLGHYILYGANMALPSSMWHTVRAYTCSRTDIHEDLDLAIHAHQNNFTIVYRPSLMAMVRVRRVHSHRQALWANLVLWPQTLRIHHNHLWRIAWLGAVLLFIGSPIIPVFEYLAQLAGKEALPD